MANIKFSELASAVSLDEDDVLALSHEQGGGWTSLKTTVEDLGNKINNDITYADLTSTDKKIVGAINEKVDWKSNGVLGAKNFNLYPYNETNHTENGVVWTDIGDGTVKANNKATANSDFFCHSRIPNSNNPLQLPNGDYILTGCPSGGGNSTFLLRVQATLDGSATTIAQDNGNGATFTVNGDDNNTDFAVVTVDCRVVNGYTANDLVFEPMIRRVEDLDDTFQPFSMTNQQLTNVVKGVPSTAGTYTLQATRNSNGVITYSWV